MGWLLCISLSSVAERELIHVLHENKRRQKEKETGQREVTCGGVEVVLLVAAEAMVAEARWFCISVLSLFCFFFVFFPVASSSSSSLPSLFSSLLSRFVSLFSLPRSPFPFFSSSSPVFIGEK